MPAWSAIILVLGHNNTRLGQFWCNYTRSGHNNTDSFASLFEWRRKFLDHWLADDGAVFLLGGCHPILGSSWRVVLLPSAWKNHHQKNFSDVFQLVMPLRRAHCSFVILDRVRYWRCTFLRPSFLWKKGLLFDRDAVEYDCAAAPPYCWSIPSGVAILCLKREYSNPPMLSLKGTHEVPMQDSREYSNPPLLSLKGTP